MKRLLTGILFLTLFAIAGCNPTEPPAPPENSTTVAPISVRIDLPGDDTAELRVIEARHRKLLAQHRLRLARENRDYRVQLAVPVTHTVPDDIATIQGAVDVANPGDKIVVRASGGPYSEYVVITTEDLRLVGEDDPIVQGGFFVNGADDVKIERFSIEEAGETCVDVTASDDVHLLGLTIDSEDEKGIEFSGGSDNLHIRDCEVSSEELEAIEGFDCLNAHIRNNTVSSEEDDGIELNNCDGGKLFGNTCNGNSADGIDLDGGSNYILHGNECNGNGDVGIEVDAADTKIGPFNTANDNSFIGILLGTGAESCLLHKNEACGNGFDDIFDEGTANWVKNNTTNCGP